MRSFTLAFGLKLSSLASTVALQPSATLFNCTSGVFPISSVMSFATFILPPRVQYLQFCRMCQPSRTRHRDTQRSEAHEQGGCVAVVPQRYLAPLQLSHAVRPSRGT